MKRKYRNVIIRLKQKPEVEDYLSSTLNNYYHSIHTREYITLVNNNYCDHKTVCTSMRSNSIFGIYAEFYTEFTEKLSYIISDLLSQISPEEDYNNLINKIIIPEVKKVLPRFKGFNYKATIKVPDYSDSPLYYKDKIIESDILTKDFKGEIFGKPVIKDFLEKYKLSLSEILRDENIIIITFVDEGVNLIEDLIRYGIWNSENVDFMYTSEIVEELTKNYESEI